MNGNNIVGYTRCLYTLKVGCTFVQHCYVTKVFALKTGCMFRISVANNTVGRNDFTFS